jgi:hypothetical protein
VDIDPQQIAYNLVPLDDEAEFLDRQGRVRARVSVNFVAEFGCCLGAPLRRP